MITIRNSRFVFSVHLILLLMLAAASLVSADGRQGELPSVRIIWNNPLNVETHQERHDRVIRRLVMRALDDYMGRGMTEEQALHQILADYHCNSAHKLARQMLDQLEQRAKEAEGAEAVSNNNNVAVEANTDQGESARYLNFFPATKLYFQV
jgi:hypothetical protein